MKQNRKLIEREKENKIGKMKGRKWKNKRIQIEEKNGKRES